jgi:hypothetical protein
MIDMGAISMRWWGIAVPSGSEERRRGGRADPALRVVCPHCTNIDTLTRHCANPVCGWVSCTCGALAYSRRRHRHPRHGSDRDTCHDPRAAV